MLRKSKHIVTESYKGFVVVLVGGGGGGVFFFPPAWKTTLCTSLKGLEYSSSVPLNVFVMLKVLHI